MADDPPFVRRGRRHGPAGPLHDEGKTARRNANRVAGSHDFGASDRTKAPGGHAGGFLWRLTDI